MRMVRRCVHGGTGSKPPGCKGWQRPRRARVSQPPRSTPMLLDGLDARSASRWDRNGSWARAAGSGPLVETDQELRRRWRIASATFFHSASRLARSSRVRARRAPAARTHDEVDRGQLVLVQRGRTRARCGGCGCAPTESPATFEPRRARGARRPHRSIAPSRRRIRRPCAGRVRRRRRNRACGAATSRRQCEPPGIEPLRNSDRAPAPCASARDQPAVRESACVRPLARRRASTSRPFLVAMRARKPCVRVRRTLLG